MSCPADVYVAAGTECRASAGACDVAETCQGIAALCASARAHVMCVHSLPPSRLFSGPL